MRDTLMAAVTIVSELSTWNKWIRLRINDYNSLRRYNIDEYLERCCIIRSFDWPNIRNFSSAMSMLIYSVFNGRHNLTRIFEIYFSTIFFSVRFRQNDREKRTNKKNTAHIKNEANASAVCFTANRITSKMKLQRVGTCIAYCITDLP